MVAGSARLGTGLCPQCGNTGSIVYDSRQHPVGRLRRRRCLECGERWVTLEMPLQDAPAVQELQQAIPIAIEKLIDAQHLLERINATLPDLSKAPKPLEAVGIGEVAIHDD
jgi:transcriptional regulator NrdR family protein